MEPPTLRESTCARQVARFCGRLGRLGELSPEQRAALRQEMQALVDSLAVPRVRGDEPPTTQSRAGVQTRSPRTRG